MNYRAVARQAARRYGIDPGTFVRQIEAESTFDPNAHSPAGALGIAQIMPGTAAAWGVNPHDPVAALNAAAKHMAGYVRQFGSYRNALVAYNAGPGRVGHPLLPETAAYISHILGAGHADPAPPRTSGSAPSPSTTKYFPAKTHEDISGALLDTLLDPTSHGHLLQSAMTRLDSGGYTTTTPGRAVTTPGSPRPLMAPNNPDPGPHGGTTTMDGHTIAAWMAPALQYARAHGWHGTIISGVRSRAEQAQLYARYEHSGFNHAYLAARPGQSNHEIENGGAVDVTDPAGLNAVLRGYSGRKPIWGGPIIGDQPHFSANGH